MSDPKVSGDSYLAEVEREAAKRFEDALPRGRLLEVRSTMKYALRWPDDDGPWRITVDLDWIERRLTPVGIVIETWDQSVRAAVTSDLLRGLTLSAVMVRVLAGMEKVRVALPTDWITSNETTITKRPMPRSGRSRGRPRKYGPEHLAQVAQIYLDAAERKESPHRAVESALDLSRHAAAKWIGQAVKAGLLHSQGPGRLSTALPAGLSGKATTKGRSKSGPRG